MFSIEPTLLETGVSRKFLLSGVYGYFGNFPLLMKRQTVH